MNLDKICAVDNFGNVILGFCKKTDGKLILTIPKENIPKESEYIYAFDDVFKAKVDSDGYYACSNDFERHSGFLTYFKKRDDFDELLEINLANMFGVRTKEDTAMAIVSGMPYVYQLHMTKRGDTYRLGLYYDLKRYAIDENIVVEISFLGKNATYVDIAKAYRNYQLTVGGCVPIKDRMNSTIEYVKDSVEIRIRMGWKPVPPTVLEQTVENEPYMHIACTFERVKDIVDELKKQGVEKAELCLVGWNKSGHDGRWPTAFPVEEKLGGEEALKDLIEYTKDNGYKIVCHTNSTGCYHISSEFNEGEIVVKRRDGSLAVNNEPWSGGKAYMLCPHKGLEFARRDLPKIKSLGFEGVHYIDVMSIVKPKQCFDKNHPVSLRESLKLNDNIMELAKETFGGFSSEGAFDHCAKCLDYVLYTCWNRKKKCYMDEGVPLWEIIYHGIIMNNAGSNTVNYTIKGADDRLQLIESCARPAFYFYSKFTSNNSDWMGIDDIRADNDDDIKFAVSKISQACSEYRKYSRLQTEFIEDYQKIQGDEVTEVTYSDGTKIVINFSDEDFNYNGQIVKAKNYFIL